MSGIIISMATVLMVVTNAQYHSSVGDLHYEVIQTSIEGCANNVTITTYVATHSPIKPPKIVLISLIQFVFSTMFFFLLSFIPPEQQRLLRK